MDVSHVPHCCSKDDTTADTVFEETQVSSRDALSLLTRFCNQFDADVATASHINDSDGPIDVDVGVGYTPVSHSRQQLVNNDRVQTGDDDRSDGSSSSSSTSRQLTHFTQFECRSVNALPWHSKTSTTSLNAGNDRRRADDRRSSRSPPKSAPFVSGFDRPSSAGVMASTRSKPATAIAASTKAHKRKLQPKMPLTSSSKRGRTSGGVARLTQRVVVPDEDHRLQKFAEYYSRLTSMQRIGKFQLSPAAPSKTPNIFDVASTNICSASSSLDCQTAINGRHDWRILQPLGHQLTGCAGDITYRTFDSPGIFSGALHRRRLPVTNSETYAPRDITALPSAMLPPETTTASLFFGRKLTELSRCGTYNPCALPTTGPFRPPSHMQLQTFLPPTEVQVNIAASPFVDSIGSGETSRFASIRPTFSRKVMPSMYDGDRCPDGLNSSSADHGSGPYGFRWNVDNVRRTISSDPTYTLLESRDAPVATSLFTSPYGPSSRLPPLIGHCTGLDCSNRVTDLAWPFPVSDVRGSWPTSGQQLTSSTAFALRRHDRHLDQCTAFDGLRDSLAFSGSRNLQSTIDSRMSLVGLNFS